MKQRFIRDREFEYTGKKVKSYEAPFWLFTSILSYMNHEWSLYDNTAVQDWIRNPALWLVTRANKMELSSPLGTTRRVPQGKFP